MQRPRQIGENYQQLQKGDTKYHRIQDIKINKIREGKKKVSEKHVQFWQFLINPLYFSKTGQAVYK